jgi:hypothetical protein
MPDSNDPLSGQLTVRLSVRALIRAKRDAGAARVMAKLGRVIGHSLEIETCQPYWKDPMLLSVSASALLTGASRAEIVYDFLRATAGLGDRSVRGPSENADQTWNMDIFITVPKGRSVSGAPGLVWLDCSVGTVTVER